jgi:hypothetical protein
MNTFISRFAAGFLGQALGHAFFGTEEINSFVTVEELKDFVWRK